MRPVLSSALGRVFSGVFAAILLVRRPRPIHAHGVLLAGTIAWRRRRQSSGLPWVDEAPASPVPVLARTSRSLGLPPPLPDVVGLAVRVEGPRGSGDLELSSTGFGVPSRFWLAPHRSPSRARLGTLFPYRGVDGPVMLCARTAAPTDLPVALEELAERLSRETWHLVLYWARPGGLWHPFADLELAAVPNALERASHPDLRFDAVEYPLPGVESYAWSVAVRQPSYRRARRFR